MASFNLAKELYTGFRGSELRMYSGCYGFLYVRKVEVVIHCHLGIPGLHVGSYAHGK